MTGGLFLSNLPGGPAGPGGVRIVGGQVAAAGPGVRAEPGDEVVDLTGYVLLPGLAEPHAHLDKAFTAGRTAASTTGDLPAAIAAWIGLRGQLAEADFAAHGGTDRLIRKTHTDVGAEVGLHRVPAAPWPPARRAGGHRRHRDRRGRQLPGHRPGLAVTTSPRHGTPSTPALTSSAESSLARPGPRGGLPAAA